MTESANGANSNQLPLEDATDLLLALLYAPGSSSSFGEPIEGRTRLQKLMFLLQQDVGPKELISEAQEYGYTPYKMGPYSQRLTQVLEELQSAGIIKAERLEYLLTDDSDPGLEGADVDPPEAEHKRVESLRYHLSELGEEIAEKIWRGLSEEKREGLSEFKEFFNSLTLRQLLIFTYDRFPRYTSESIIRENLGM